MTDERAAVAKLDADAVKAGLPAGSFSSPSADAKVVAEVAAVRAAAKPTAEENRLRQVWADASATRGALQSACSAARASDPKGPACTDAAECVTQARAADTSERCSDLVDYTMLEDEDAFAQDTPASHTKLCAEAKRTYPVPPPSSMAAERQLIATKHCP